MEFKYRGKIYKFPSSLSEIKLSDRIEFDQEYGEQIESLRSSVFKTNEAGEPLPFDEDAAEILNMQVAVMNFSFFSNIPMDEVKAHIPIDQVAAVFFACYQQLYIEQDSIELQPHYDWNGEKWYLSEPQLTFENNMTFNELITSKQIVKQVHEMGAGNWEAVKNLAAVFLRKENEKFDEKWLAPNSERLTLMGELPMDIALHVAFFLQSSISLFPLILPSFQAEELATKAPI